MFNILTDKKKEERQCEKQDREWKTEEERGWGLDYR